MSPPTCPQCGESMQLRVNTRTKEQFWGCVHWPTCDGTQRLEERDESAPSERQLNNDKRRWRYDG